MSVARTTIATGLTAVALAVAGMSHANAATAPSATKTASEPVVACIAISHVNVGACLRDPYKDLPRPMDVVEDTTGVPLQIPAPRLPEG